MDCIICNYFYIYKLLCPKTQTTVLAVTAVTHLTTSHVDPSTVTTPMMALLDHLDTRSHPPATMRRNMIAHVGKDHPTGAHVAPHPTLTTMMVSMITRVVVLHLTTQDHTLPIMGMVDLVDHDSAQSVAVITGMVIDHSAMGDSPHNITSGHYHSVQRLT